MNIAIVMGSPSVEHFGSCVSGTHVANVLQEKHNVKRIVIGMNGEWAETTRQFSYADPDCKPFYEKALKIGKPTWKKINLNHVAQLLQDIDVVVPLTHGSYGEGGPLQGFLEILGIPYTGPGVKACVLAQHKNLTKIIAQNVGVSVSPFISFGKAEWAEELNSLLEKIKEHLRFPIYVKPNDGGFSLGLSKVEKFKYLQKAIDTSFRYSDHIIVEEGIDGFEIEAAIIGNNHPQVAESLGEIVPNGYYDLENKLYTPAVTYVPAKNISEETIQKLRLLALKMYKACNCAGFSRIDFLVDKKTMIPYLNEITPIPGCTEYSLFPVMFTKSGMQEVELWEKIIQFALERFQA